MPRLLLSAEEKLKRNRESRRKWRKANPEKEREYAKAYRKANSEKCRARFKAWAEANPEKIRAYVPRYKEANRQKLRDKARKYSTELRNAYVLNCSLGLRKSDIPEEALPALIELKRTQLRAYRMVKTMKEGIA